MAHTQSVEQLAADLKTAQDALRNVRTILAALDSRTPTDGLEGTLWFEIGRAQGTCSQALIMSGDRR
jgi:hypothetical protein